jgi:excinuclease ABC subunit A
VKRVTLVDQSPLGRTSRGNPATYSGAWDRVRQLFAASPAALVRGFGPGTFSFNVAGGRCEACAGEGSETIEMQFLADVSLSCPSCRGQRFRDEVLGVEIDGKSVGDVLKMTIEDALVFFRKEAAIVRALSPLARLGLGYLSLGQPLSTLSGGEAQRLKLARALVEVRRDGLFLLDEPSAGLHADEVQHVNEAIAALATAGANVVVVEHDLSIIAQADWIIEFGPGAGSEGGQIVAEGTPSSIIAGQTATALALRDAMKPSVIPRTRPKRETSSVGIEVVEAREHNLQSVSTVIPHGKLVVVTGPSGSGKSTLAFDVVFAEGQRRFLETLTPYARQFLPTLPRPDVDRVVGVPPAISLEQRTSRSGVNSTVATVTEIAQYLRLLFAKVGRPHCPNCGDALLARDPDEAFQSLRAKKGSFRLLAPAVVARKGTYLEIFNAASRAGFARAIVDGTEVNTDDPPRLKKNIEHSIDLVVFDGEINALSRTLFDRALTLGLGAVKLMGKREEILISTTRACRSCGTSVPKMDPRWFSFNTKQGQCEICAGAGFIGDEPDAEPCGACEGTRLAPVPRAVRFAGIRYHEATRMSVADAHQWMAGLAFHGDDALIAKAPHAELVRRLAFVVEVGLGYLSLDRRAGTLSGGEMQRLRLAAQLGSGLTGALYVLDEPTIGLHPRDTQRLINNLRALVDTGSTVLMVEHDREAILAADHLIDLGPTGGRGGGKIIAHGPTGVVLRDPASPTGRALREEELAFRSMHPTPSPANASGAIASGSIAVYGAKAHNLAIEELRFPLGRLTVVAGVSGSGKSTLVTKVLFPAVRRALGFKEERPLAHRKVEVPKALERALFVDQSPIGRTPRSVPATFLGIFDDIRKLFAGTPEAKVKGFNASRFSFNTALGRCPVCDGQGVTSHEMSFLPNVTTLCEACWGARFEPSTLTVKYLGLDMGQVLDLSAEEAHGLFRAHRKISAPLKVMSDLGLGYLKIGQGSHTLSGGEAQRLKLAAELAETLRPRPSLYVLDEPTTGLHWSDVARLIGVLRALSARGHTVIVIEHHPGVMAAADHLIELGPEAGAGGGQVVAEGAPREVAAIKSPTGNLLRALFNGVAPPSASASKRRASGRATSRTA